ncbi:hypothetical protein, conserved [Eimeria necatrix]|uniref:Transmembrane protein n=1 Tax=Eimeria necatrix TaxID=51315 RepID=U6MKM8_9EIME|nr:hypothetical protein, conserved [Eimeria necatrix]CDJ64546.1 hypothetical protein, conserved [Eimeria necatrix]
MKHFETQMPSSAADPLSGAEARSTSACSPEATPTGPVVCPSTASAAATAAGGKRSCKGSEASVRSRCSFCINFFFHATLALVAAVGGVLYCLPPSHWLHVEVSRALSALASSPDSPSRLNLGESLRAAAEQLEGTELAFVSPHLLALAAWGYLDAAAIGALSLLTLLLGSALVRGMLTYKRDREIEVNPPPIRYCQNQMTLEEYNKKDATYAAVQELMASPEFQALKAQRASQGSEAWNWQRRVGSEAVSDPEEEEEGDATETDGDTDTAQ